MTTSDKLSQRWFNWVHRHQLVYNTSWEDPRLDHEALNLTHAENVLVITSAGCNVLDYALAGPNRVYAVDVNPLQNALLELKIAGIRQLDYEPFFELFGRGRSSDWPRLYRDALRPCLSSQARQIWDQFGRVFSGSGPRSSLYFRGSAGLFAWMLNGYINRVARIRNDVNDLLQARSLDEQHEIYCGRNLAQTLFRPLIKWCLRRDGTLAMLGVPRSQRLQLDNEYPGGIAQFVEDRIEAVFTQRLLHENYFYRVYLTGEYALDCCPRYLQPEHFEKLKGGLVDCVLTATSTVDGFLRDYRGSISRYVLLDHMDWLYSHHPHVLEREWQAIVDRAAPDARILWRSAGLSVDFVDPIAVRINGQSRQIGEVLHYQTDLARRLHETDRVNTYGSFYIADLHAA